METANTLVFYDQKTERLLSFNLLKKKWTKMKRVHDEMIFGFTSLIMGEYIYALLEKKMFRLKYSDSSAKWIKLKQEINEDHGYWPPAVVLNETIYVCGGRRFATNAVKKYDFEKWQDGTPMNIARKEAILVAAKGCIYCIGGHDDKETSLLSVEKFNTETEKWSEIKPMPRPTYFSGGSAVQKDEFIYVADCMGLMVCDIKNNSWRTLEPENWPKPGNYYRMETDMTVANDELHVIFNFVDEGIEIYHVDQKTGISLIEKKKNIQISFTKSFALM